MNFGGVLKIWVWLYFCVDIISSCYSGQLVSISSIAVVGMSSRYGKGEWFDCVVIVVLFILVFFICSGLNVC